MESLLNFIDAQISMIETTIPGLVYNLMLQKEVHNHTHQLKVYDETLNQFILKLDGTPNVDKSKRKERIIKIQEIQQVIDKSLQKSTDTVEISISDLNNINETLKIKAHEIDNLKKELTKLRIENSDLKQTIRMIHNHTTDFVDFSDYK